MHCRGEFGKEKTVAFFPVRSLARGINKSLKVSVPPSQNGGTETKMETSQWS
jgi:hypothetical protein